MRNRWSAQQARLRFTEFLQACESAGPQIVTQHGVETAVLVPIEHWRKLEKSNKPNLKDLLLAAEARTEELMPPRVKRRKPK